MLEGISVSRIAVGTNIEFREFNSVDRLIRSIGGQDQGELTMLKISMTVKGDRGVIATSKAEAPTQ